MKDIRTAFFLCLAVWLLAWSLGMAGTPDQVNNLPTTAVDTSSRDWIEFWASRSATMPKVMPAPKTVLGNRWAAIQKRVAAGECGSQIRAEIDAFIAALRSSQSTPTITSIKDK